MVNYLNAIEIGEMEGIRSKLAEARKACEGIEQAELARTLTEADNALQKADVKTFRKRLETVVAQLGHVK